MKSQYDVLHIGQYTGRHGQLITPIPGVPRHMLSKQSTIVYTYRGVILC